MIQPHATSSAIVYYSITNFSHRLVEQPTCNSPRLYTVNLMSLHSSRRCWERNGCEDTSRSGRGWRPCTPLSPQRMEIQFDRTANHRLDVLVSYLNRK